MALSDTLNQLGSKARPIGNCAWQTLYDSLSKEDQNALDKALQKPMPASLIVKALRQEGHKTSQDSLRAHLRGECKCPK